MAYVLDASVPVAIYKREPGAGYLLSQVDESFIGVVNLHEFAEHLIRLGATDVQVVREVNALPYEVVDADYHLSIEAARIARNTRRAGLSLGDRFCLALAKRLDLPALTGDRRWAEVADDIGVRVELFR